MIRFPEPQQYTFQLDGGYDLVSAHHLKKPGLLIAGSNVEMVSGKQGYSRPGGFERCCDDVLPSETMVVFFEIKAPAGGAISIDDLFTTGAKSFRSLDDIAVPAIGDIVAVATHDTGFVVDDVCTCGAVSFTIASLVTDTSSYTSEELRAYIRQAIEQTRDNVPAVTGAGTIPGGFRLRGVNYVVREGVLYRAVSGAWEAVEMPQVMYFDEGVYEFSTGDFITDGTETATIASVTVQGGAWNYTYAAADQAYGYLTLVDVTGSFTDNADLLVGETVPNIVNGTFAADTDWTKGDGWTIAAGVADSDGTQTASSDLSQAFTLTAGRSVSLTYTLTVTSGSITPFLGDTIGTAVTTAGAKAVTLERTTGDNTIGFRASADFVGTIDDVVRVVSIDNVPAVVNGTFGADSDWTKGTGWTIAAGVANCDGTQTAVSELSQAYDVETGETVIMSFDVTRSAGAITPFLGLSDGDDISTAGSYTILIARTTGDDTIGFRADADFVGTIDNVTFTVGRRAKVASVNASYGFPSGGDYKTKVYNFTNVADADSVFGVTGAGEAFEFDGTNYIPIFFPDFPTTWPYLVDIHQERLHIGFPGGQWVMSVSGQPRVFNALLGSTTYSTGSELVGSRKIHGNALAIFAEKSIWLLLGTGVLDDTTQIRDWQFVEHDSSIGAVVGSVTEKGPPVFVSGTEFRVVYPTDDSAGYKSNPILNQIQPLLENNIENISCSLWCRKKSQYRLFLSTGGAIYATFESGKPKGGTAISFPIPVAKVWSAIEDSVEKIWFVSTTGYLYRMDSGNTFDDGYIEGSFRVPFFHYGNSRQEKSFPQMELEFDSPVLLTGDTEITYTVNHAYGESGYPRPAIDSVQNIDSAGGFYGANAGFGLFVWGGPVVSRIIAYLDGYGPNMSILVVYKTRYDNSFTFLAATVDYIQLGLVGQES